MRHPEVLTTQWPIDDVALRELCHQQTAVAAGPGLGRRAKLEQALRVLIDESPVLVLDADALNILAESESCRDALRARRSRSYTPAILTPHPGEFIRLAPDQRSVLANDRQSAARSLAESLQSIVVLKGKATVVAAPSGETWINTSGNAGMAKAGSGDVLTGLILGLAAQGYEPFTAARCGVWLHGRAGDYAAEKNGERSILPTDLMAALPPVLMSPSADERR